LKRARSSRGRIDLAQLGLVACIVRLRRSRRYVSRTQGCWPEVEVVPGAKIARCVAQRQRHGSSSEQRRQRRARRRRAWRRDRSFNLESASLRSTYAPNNARRRGHTMNCFVRLKSVPPDSFLSGPTSTSTSTWGPSDPRSWLLPKASKSVLP
jgi:hypothetical protein